MDRPRVVVGRDTRRSGPMLEDALCAGVASAGGVALRAGVIPTPAVAWLARDRAADLGAVISASHNPYPDNGIKFFGGDGFKLTDAEEQRIEALLTEAFDPPTGYGVGTSEELADGAGPTSPTSRRSSTATCPACAVAVDCAHGAASAAGRPAARPGSGVRHDLIGAAPNGVNINVRRRLHAPRARRREGRGRRVRPRARVRRRRRPAALRSTPPAAPSTAITSSPSCARDLLLTDGLPGRRVVLTVDGQPRAAAALDTMGMLDRRDRRRRPLRARGDAPATAPSWAASSPGT